MYNLNQNLRIVVKGTDFKLQRKISEVRWVNISHHAKLSSAVLGAYERLLAEEMAEYSIQMPCHHCAGLGMLERLSKKIDEVALSLEAAISVGGNVYADKQ